MRPYIKSDIVFAIAVGILALGLGVALCWFGWGIYQEGRPMTLRGRWSGGGRTISAAEAAAWMAGIGVLCLLVACGHIKYLFTGRSFPFPNYRLRPYSKDRPIHPKCPFCGYDRSGLSIAAPCPECGKKIP